MHAQHPIIHHRAWRRIALQPLGGIVAVFAAAVSLSGALPSSPAWAQTAADSTVTLTWTAPGDDGNVGRATSYDIRYRTVNISGTDTTSWWSAATQVSGEPAPNVAGSTETMIIGGLLPLTTYYFIVRAADEVPNWSGFSNVASKTTSGDNTAPAAVADLTVTGTTGNSIAVRWTAPGDDGNTGTATSYDIRYSTSSITNGNWSSATQASGEPTPAAAGTQQTFTLTGLSGSQTYYVAIRATDERGNLAALSNVVSGTTNDTTPPAPVRDLSRRDGPAAERGALARIGPAVDERHDS